jgi:hypothetical protein
MASAAVTFRERSGGIPPAGPLLPAACGLKDQRARLPPGVPAAILQRGACPPLVIRQSITPDWGRERCGEGWPRGPLRVCAFECPSPAPRRARVGGLGTGEWRVPPGQLDAARARVVTPIGARQDVDVVSLFRIDNVFGRGSSAADEAGHWGWSAAQSKRLCFRGCCMV